MLKIVASAPGNTLASKYELARLSNRKRGDFFGDIGGGGRGGDGRRKAEHRARGDCVRFVDPDRGLDVAAPGDAVKLHAPSERSQTRRFVRVGPWERGRRRAVAERPPGVDQANPKKPGTACNLRYEAYKSATTVAEFLEKGGTPADLTDRVGRESG